MVDGLFTSKINYGIQLYGKVRLSDEDPINNDIKAIQMVQNKMARLLNGKTLKDKIPTKTLLENVKPNQCEDQITRNVENTKY